MTLQLQSLLQNIYGHALGDALCLGQADLKLPDHFGPLMAKLLWKRSRAFIVTLQRAERIHQSWLVGLAHNVTSVTAMTVRHYTFMHLRPVETSTEFSWVLWMPNCLAMDTSWDNYYFVQRNTHRMSSVGLIQLQFSGLRSMIHDKFERLRFNVTDITNMHQVWLFLYP